MALHKLQALQCLSVAFCDRLSTRAAAALLRCLPSLVHFDSSFCDRVDLRALCGLLAMGRGRLAPLLLANDRGSLLCGQADAGSLWVRLWPCCMRLQQNKQTNTALRLQCRVQQRSFAN